MRYTVKYYNGIQIINDLVTNNLSQAIEREMQLRDQWGKDCVWTADRITELMVG
jgi:hypothetical protein